MTRPIPAGEIPVANPAARVIRSIREEGMGRTLAYARARSSLALWRWLDSGFDRRHHVDTAGVADFDPARAVGSVAGANHYEPVPPGEVRRLIGSLPIRFEDFVFVDVGSGKGRALFVAAEYPFRRVVGVEFARELHEAALANFCTFVNPRRRAAELVSLCEDARAYEWPEVPAVLFFYSPFQPALLRPVLDRLEASLAAAPRETWIVYGSGIPACLEMVRADALRLGWEVASESRMRLGPFARASRRDVLVLRAGPASPGRG